MLKRIAKIESYGFECIAGPLELCVDWLELKDNVKNILVEVERLNRVFANQGNLREEIVELKSQLQAAQALAAQHLANQDYLCALERKRVARECIDYVNNHANDCGCSKRIAHDIRARYGVD